MHGSYILPHKANAKAQNCCNSYLKDKHFDDLIKSTILIFFFQFSNEKAIFPIFLKSSGFLKLLI